MIAERKEEPEEERCGAGLKCPQCGENRIDHLVWDEEGVAVTCDTCGCVYQPPERPKSLQEDNGQ